MTTSTTPAAPRRCSRSTVAHPRGDPARVLREIETRMRRPVSQLTLHTPATGEEFPAY